MSDLAAALEAAEQGSRELSDRVLLALGWYCEEAVFPAGTVFRNWHDNTGTHRYTDGPARTSMFNVTESVDNGLALLREMPEWKGWGSISWPGRREGELVNDAKVTLHHVLSSGGGPRVHGFAKTPALALAAALVRAAEAQKEPG